MRKAWKRYMVIITITAMLFTGCRKDQSSQTNITTDLISNTANLVGTTLSTTSEVIVDKEFTAKDLEVGYEEITATHITLSESDIEVNGEGATEKGNILTISKEGVYVITGSLVDGQIVVEAGDTDKIQIVLNGVNITCLNNAPIYIKSADKVFITLKEGTENNLKDNSEYVQVDDNTVDGVIFSKADLTLNGSGTLNIIGNYKHGIVSKDDIVITGGIYNITAVKDALNGKDAVKIKDGTFTLNVTQGNGIQSKNGDDGTKGYVYITGGEINILNCQEGIEGTVIVIEGGTIYITAQDDGLNVASSDSTSEVEDFAFDSANDFVPSGKGGGNQFVAGGPGGEFENNTDCYILISGGTIIIDAGGDGIDSNGSLYISGGTIYVSGSANSADGGLDYNGSGEITGGTVVVAGSSGMIQGFSDTSTQYSLLYNLSTASEAETEVILTDVDGKVVVSYIPNKQYQSVVISSPNLVKDATYTLTCGNQVSEIILSEIVTSNGLQGINVPDGQGMRGPRGEGNIEKQSGQRDMVKPENKNPTGTQNDK